MQLGIHSRDKLSVANIAKTIRICYHPSHSGNSLYIFIQLISNMDKSLFVERMYCFPYHMHNSIAVCILT
jgi:hypothetical protein